MAVLFSKGDGRNGHVSEAVLCVILMLHTDCIILIYRPSKCFLLMEVFLTFIDCYKSELFLSNILL